MTDAERFYNEIADRYMIAMAACDYAKAADIAREVYNWLGCRSQNEQILPTGDATGTAGYLVHWAERRIVMLEGLAKG